MISYHDILKIQPSSLYDCAEDKIQVDLGQGPEIKTIDQLINEGHVTALTKLIRWHSTTKRNGAHPIIKCAKNIYLFVLTSGHLIPIDYNLRSRAPDIDFEMIPIDSQPDYQMAYNKYKTQISYPPQEGKDISPKLILKNKQKLNKN